MPSFLCIHLEGYSVTRMFLAIFLSIRQICLFILSAIPTSFLSLPVHNSRPPRKLTNQCCHSQVWLYVNRAIVAKENAKKCAALSEVLFYFLDLLRILFSLFPLCCRVLLSSLVALPRKTFLICDHLVEKPTIWWKTRKHSIRGFSLSGFLWP